MHSNNLCQRIHRETHHLNDTVTLGLVIAGIHSQCLLSWLTHSLLPCSKPKGQTEAKSRLILPPWMGAALTISSMTHPWYGLTYCGLQSNAQYQGKPWSPWTYAGRPLTMVRANHISPPSPLWVSTLGRRVQAPPLHPLGGCHTLPSAIVLVMGPSPSTQLLKSLLRGQHWEGTKMPCHVLTKDTAAPCLASSSLGVTGLGTGMAAEQQDSPHCPGWGSGEGGRERDISKLWVVCSLD